MAMHVRSLVDQGRLQRTPWKRGRSDQFVSITKQGGVLEVRYKSVVGPVVKFTGLAKKSYDPAAMLAKLVAYRYVRSFRQAEGLEAGMGSTEPTLVRAKVRELRETFIELTKVCDQLLVMDLWKDKPWVHEQMGTVSGEDWPDLVSMAVEFEDWVYGSGSSDSIGHRLGDSEDTQ